MTKPKVIYMGTPDFAVPALEALIQTDVDVAYVVTQPDRPRGRGHKLSPSPVKQVALNHNIPVLQPEKIKDNDDFISMLAEVSPNLIVVVAYGKILPKRILDLPSCGVVNIHASLLPKFRGPAPIHRAIEAGEKESGVTLMYVTEPLDEGDMITSFSLNIEGMNSGELHDVLAEEGANLLADNIKSILSGEAYSIKQDDAKATYTQKLTREDGHVDFSADTKQIIQKVLAMTPFPGAFAMLNDTKFKIIKASACEAPENCTNYHKPGTILTPGEAKIVVVTGDGFIDIEKLQIPGGKPMTAEEYLRGHAVPDAAIFE